MSEEPIAVDSIISVCQKEYRRIVLEVLVEQQRSLTVNDLTKAIFNYNSRTEPTEMPEDGLTEIRLSLYHVDLPKLAAEGFINYNQEHKLVELTEQLDQIQPTLSTILDANPSAKAPIEL